MNVEEFYTLAEFLRQNPPQSMIEGAYRSAISRYYYFVFLKLRDNIVKEDGRDETKELLASPQAYSAHAALQAYLQELGKRAKKDDYFKSTIGLADIEEVTFKTAQQLRTLHEKRKFADYNTKQINIKKLEECVTESKKLTDNIRNKKKAIMSLLKKLKDTQNLPDPKDIRRKLERKKKQTKHYFSEDN